MGSFDPRKYELTFKEWFRYNSDITYDNYSVLKDHGDYVQMMFPSGAKKGHDTYDIYLDSTGRITKVVGHSGNKGFDTEKKL